MPKIVITYNRPLKRKHPGPKRGVLPDDRRDELLGRRKKEFINFYDLGQVNTGTTDSPVWEDLAFQDVRSLTLSGSPLKPVGPMVFGLTGWDNLRAKIFEIGIADWKQKYRRLDLTAAQRYYVDVYTGAPGPFFDPYSDATKRYSLAQAGSRTDLFSGAVVTGDNWSAKGLKLPAAPSNFVILATSLFPGIPQANIKVTNTPVYADPGVTLNVGKKADVYLVPLPVINQGSDGTTGVLANYEGFLNLFFEIMPRSNFLFSDELKAYVEAHHTTPAASAVYALDSVFSESFGDAPIGFADIKTYVRNRPNARYYYKGTGFIAPGLFPQNPSRYNILFGTNTTNNFAGGAVSLESGALLAVIRTAAQDFYVWYTTHTAIAVDMRFTG